MSQISKITGTSPSQKTHSVPFSFPAPRPPHNEQAFHSVHIKRTADRLLLVCNAAALTSVVSYHVRPHLGHSMLLSHSCAVRHHHTDVLSERGHWQVHFLGLCRVKRPVHHVTARAARAQMLGWQEIGTFCCFAISHVPFSAERRDTTVQI